MPPNETVESSSVVIVYDRLDHVGKALATYMCLMKELADKFAPKPRLWRMDVAIAPDFAAVVEQDIAAAEIIILAVDGRRPCPPEFQRWKGDEVPHRGVPARVIIALVEPSDEPAPAPESWHGILRKGAVQIHPEIFVFDPPDGRERPTDSGGLQPLLGEPDASDERLATPPPPA